MHHRTRFAFDLTQELWQRRTKRPLSAEDAREIQQNISGFFRTLLDWQRRAANTQAATTCTAGAPEPLTTETPPGTRGEE